MKVKVEERLETLLERGWKAYKNPNSVEAWEEFEEAMKELGFELVESEEDDFVIRDRNTKKKYVITGDFSKWVEFEE